jgi:hypothetical protein
LIYEGDWEENTKTGKGKLYSAQGNLIYDGEFARNMFHGSGSFTENPLQY